MRKPPRRSFLLSAVAATLASIEKRAAGSNAVPTEQLREQAVSVFDYLTEPERSDVRAGTLLFNVRPNVAKAFAASKHVYFPPGSYYLGDASNNVRIFDINGAGGQISILSEGLVKLVCNTKDYSIPQFFHVADANGVKIGTFHFHDKGYDNSATSTRWKGAAGIMFEITGGGTKTVKNVNIDAVHCTNMVHTVLCAGNFPNVRVEHIKIAKIYADTCYYGFNCQNNGDLIEIGELRTKNVKRSYFVYGVTRHKVNVYSKDNQSSTGDINISSNCNSIGVGSNTSDLDIHYTCASPTSVLTLININIFGEANRRIHDIKLHLDIESSTRAEVVSIKTYTSAASVSVKQNNGPTTNIYDNFTIHGQINAPLAPSYIDMRSRPTIKGRMNIGAGIDMSKVTHGVKAHFNISAAT
jgi:hypothetical protein